MASYLKIHLEMIQMDYCDIQTMKAVFVLSYILNDPGQCGKMHFCNYLNIYILMKNVMLA